jgi:hypothetical protein
MQRTKIALMGPLMGLALVTLPLGACASDGYGYGSGYTYSTGVAWNDYPYDVYYDDYYGPIYDGYWGSDNYFYYRNSGTGGYHRGDGRHFRHNQGGNNYHRYQGTVHQPSNGTRMPYYPGNKNNGHRRGHR